RGHTHPFFALSQSLVLVYQLRNIDTRTDVPGKRSLYVISRDALVRYPSILAIVSPQAVLHNVWLPRVQCVGVNLPASFQIIFMQAFDPAVSKLLFHAASRKLQPWLVKERAKLVHASHPDKNGSSIRYNSKT